VLTGAFFEDTAASVRRMAEKNKKNKSSSSYSSSSSTTSTSEIRKWRVPPNRRL
jgi:hypothetical protein